MKHKNIFPLIVTVGILILMSCYFPLLIVAIFMIGFVLFKNALDNAVEISDEEMEL